MIAVLLHTNHFSVAPLRDLGGTDVGLMLMADSLFRLQRIRDLLRASPNPEVADWQRILSDHAGNPRESAAIPTRRLSRSTGGRRPPESCSNRPAVARTSRSATRARGVGISVITPRSGLDCRHAAQRRRMSRVVAELALEPGTRLQTLPASVPPEVIRYARGMFQTTRDSLRFLWRRDDTWLSVHLVRNRYDPESAAAVRRSSAWAAGERVSVGSGGRHAARHTVREVDVLTLLALGLTNSGIAERLGTSARTVSTQIERLLTKLDQGTRGGLAALAVDSGLLRLPIPGGVDGTPGIGVVELEAVVSKVPRAEVAPLRPMYPRNARCSSVR